MSKYIPKSKRTKDCPQGRKGGPESWKTGPDPLTRAKYYAFLNHRAQAKYRNESYKLTWEEWESIWTHELFEKRGRRADSISLCRIDKEQPWQLDNVEMMARIDHLRQEKCKNV